MKPTQYFWYEKPMYQLYILFFFILTIFWSYIYYFLTNYHRILEFPVQHGPSAKSVVVFSFVWIAIIVSVSIYVLMYHFKRSKIKNAITINDSAFYYNTIEWKWNVAFEHVEYIKIETDIIGKYNQEIIYLVFVLKHGAEFFFPEIDKPEDGSIEKYEIYINITWLNVSPWELFKIVKEYSWLRWEYIDKEY